MALTGGVTGCSVTTLKWRSGFGGVDLDGLNDPKCGEMHRRRGGYREMHRVLFNSVARWAVPEGADDRLVDVARQAGLDPAGLRTCFASRRPLERVLQDLLDTQGLVRTLPRSCGSGTVKGA
jgi:hypothetical protein